MADAVDFASTAAIGTLGSSTDATTIANRTRFQLVLRRSTTQGHLILPRTLTADSLVDVGTPRKVTQQPRRCSISDDDNADGTNDGTMLYHNGATDSSCWLD